LSLLWRRRLILPAAVVMSLFLGATYSWSVFVGPMRRALGLGQGAAQLPFTIFYIVFPMTTLFAGALMDRGTPRRWPAWRWTDWAASSCRCLFWRRSPCPPPFCASPATSRKPFSSGFAGGRWGGW
jgi:hypothetical protein